MTFGRLFLFRQSRLVEKRSAADEPRLRAVVDSILRGPLVIQIVPEGSRAVEAVFIQRIKENVKGFQFLFVVFVISRNTMYRFQPRIGWRHSLALHLTYA